MENGVKALFIAAAAIIAALVIGLAIRQYNLGKQSADSANANITQMNQTLDESKYTAYESGLLLGSEVSSALSSLRGDQIAVHVTTLSGGNFWLNYTDASLGSRQSDDTTYDIISQSQDKSSNYYINPNGQFKGQITRNEAGTIMAVEFTQY